MKQMNFYILCLILVGREATSNLFANGDFEGIVAVTEGQSKLITPADYNIFWYNWNQPGSSLELSYNSGGLWTTVVQISGSNGEKRLCQNFSTLSPNKEYELSFDYVSVFQITQWSAWFNN